MESSGSVDRVLPRNRVTPANKDNLSVHGSQQQIILDNTDIKQNNEQNEHDSLIQLVDVKTKRRGPNYNIEDKEIGNNLDTQ